jgi:hypothetical protein
VLHRGDPPAAEHHGKTDERRPLGVDADARVERLHRGVRDDLGRAPGAESGRRRDGKRQAGDGDGNDGPTMHGGLLATFWTDNVRNATNVALRGSRR